MRALRVFLTALGFATLFAVLMISSAILTAGLHRAMSYRAMSYRAMSSSEPHPQLIAPPGRAASGHVKL
jgi:hypothetical protein